MNVTYIQRIMKYLVLQKIKRIVAAFVVITTMLPFASYSQTYGDATQLAHAKGAYMQFESERHDFGTLTFGEPAKVTFYYTNTGNEPLVIHTVKSTCGCTIPHWSKDSLAPKASEKITIEYNTNRSGQFEKGIMLYTNAINSVITLLIEGEVTHNVNKPILGK